MTSSWEILKNRLLQQSQIWGFKADLARKMGVPTSLIQRYLQGERTPGLDQLDKFAAALGQEAWELIAPEQKIKKPLTAIEHLEAALIILRNEQLNKNSHKTDD